MRLQRRGKRNYATYRVVVADRRAPVKGRFVADLGPYNPHTDEFGVDTEVAQKWLTQGVQPSPTVHNLLVEHGILKADKVTSWRPKKGQGESDKEQGGASEEREASGDEVVSSKLQVASEGDGETGEESNQESGTSNQDNKATADEATGENEKKE